MVYTLPAELALLADQIPARVRAALSPAELLARCQLAEELRKSAFAVTDRNTMYGCLERARKVVRALAPAQLQAELAGLERGRDGEGPAELLRAYSAAATEVRANNPQPPAELVKAAERTIASFATPPALPKPRPQGGSASPTWGSDVVQTSPTSWSRVEPGREALLHKTTDRS